MKLTAQLGTELEMEIPLPEKINKWEVLRFQLKEKAQKIAAKKLPTGEILVELPPIFGTFPLTLTIKDKD